MAKTRGETRQAAGRLQKRAISSDSAQSETDEGRPLKRKKAAKSASKPELQPSVTYPERVNFLWKVGAHESAAGGVENAITSAASIGANAFALFLKSQRRWTSKPLTESSIAAFKTRMKEHGYSADVVLPHGNYLVNLANPDQAKRGKSYECFIDEIKRCQQLGLRFYNFHPGSTVGAGAVDESLTYIAESINRAHEECPDVIIVIETMSGETNIIGSKFSEIATIIERVQDKSRVGVCLDTCHAFAAGYDIRTKETWDTTMKEFDHVIGLKYLRGLHLNDSRAELDSKRDLHTNVGLGHLKLQTFSHILTDPRTHNIPLILETPTHDKPEIVRKKEIEILNRLSQGGALNTEELEKEMKDIVGSVGRPLELVAPKGGKSRKKATAARRATASKKRGKKDQESESDLDDDFSDGK